MFEVVGPAQQFRRLARLRRGIHHLHGAPDGFVEVAVRVSELRVRGVKQVLDVHVELRGVGGPD
ncbi:hypothetical protein D3C83_302120 [compost metagenome]